MSAEIRNVVRATYDDTAPEITGMRDGDTGRLDEDFVIDNPRSFFDRITWARERVRELDTWIESFNPSGSRTLLEEYEAERYQLRCELAWWGRR